MGVKQDFERIALLASTDRKAQEAARQLADTAEWAQFDDADAVVVLGGDGFMLHTLHQMLDGGRVIPAYGVNRGTVGFLMNRWREGGNLAARLAKATRIGVVELLMLMPAIIVGLRTSGTVGAAWGVLLATCAIVPVVFVALRAELGIRLSHYFARLWRPTLAAAVMFAALTAWMRFAASTRIGDSHAATLLSAVTIGAAAYGLAMYAIWRLAGRPEGAESVVLHAILQKLRGSRDRLRPQERLP